MVLSLACSFAVAQPAPQNDGQEQTGDEQKTELPAFPKDENLAKIQVDAAASFDFLVDLPSVSVGKDGVVRYTLVARSAGGATNITYEGIRCKGRERKLYAFGRADRTWSAARNPQWASISSISVNRAQATLYDWFFCPAQIIVRDAEEARNLLKRGGDPSGSGSVGTWDRNQSQSR